MSVYLPKQFAVEARHAWTLMREHPLAQVISMQPDGFPMMSWIPMHIAQEGHSGQAGELLGHFSRANPQVTLIERQPELTAVFTGPHGYMPTSVYEDKLRVPTWNYLLVSARLRAHRIEGHALTDALLKSLIGDHQPSYADQWRSLPQDFTERMLSAIVAFRFEVIEIEAKFKLNQHRQESHSAMLAHYSQGNDNEQGLATWMQRLGLVS